MIRIHYIAGFTFITWGLILITPLYLHFRLSDSLIVIPLIVLLILTGIAIIKSRKYSWTLGLILGFLILVHYVLSIFNEIFKKTDLIRSYKTPEIILFAVWTALALLTLFSIAKLLKSDLRMKMRVDPRQFKLTWFGIAISGIIWAGFLLDAWYWI